MFSIIFATLLSENQYQQLKKHKTSKCLLIVLFKKHCISHLCGDDWKNDSTFLFSWWQTKPLALMVWQKEKERKKALKQEHASLFITKIWVQESVFKHNQINILPKTGNSRISQTFICITTKHNSMYKQQSSYILNVLIWQWFVVKKRKLHVS